MVVAAPPRPPAAARPPPPPPPPPPSASGRIRTSRRAVNCARNRSTARWRVSPRASSARRAPHRP
ncbi:hypothetical protein DF160_16250 [Burkholderia anthina]|nr:hypothetical protein DF160_16250 [Burkholderia anthina]